uniref:PGG domain-containing protein n=1 Tax=Aegilops tauschii TaxID=37682 RepID=M8CTV7_AEGTA
MNPPGGFWLDSRDGHTGGDPILLTTHAGRYKVFFAFNSLALVTSVVVIVMVLTRHPSSAVHKHHALEAAMILDLLSLMAAYAVGCGRDVNASVRVIALAGGLLVCVVIHIVFFTLKTRRREKPELLKKKRKLLLLFAILVVTITYQAGLAPPGGFWLDDDGGHAAGYAALSPATTLAVTPPSSIATRRASCPRCNEQPQPQPQPHEGGEDIDKDEPQLQEGGGDIDEEEPQPQEGGDETEDSGEEPQPQPQPQEQEAEEDVDRETARYTTRKYLMVVSILGASVTYQAGLIPPGGVWPDTNSSSNDGHAAGDPVLQDSNKRRYSLFFYSNPVSFLASVVVICLLQLDEPLYMFARKRKGQLRDVGGATTSPPSKSDELLRVALSTILLALVGLLFAYASGCARRWETFGYVVVLLVAVLLYIAIHVLCNTSGSGSGGGSSYYTDRQADAIAMKRTRREGRRKLRSKTMFYQKGFPLLCISKQPTPIQGSLGRIAHQAQEKKEKKQMPTTAARQSSDDPPPLHPPETNHHNPRLQTTAYQAAPPTASIPPPQEGIRRRRHCCPDMS